MELLRERDESPHLEQDVRAPFQYKDTEIGKEIEDTTNTINKFDIHRNIPTNNSRIHLIGKGTQNICQERSYQP